MCTQCVPKGEWAAVAADIREWWISGGARGGMTFSMGGNERRKAISGKIVQYGSEID